MLVNNSDGKITLTSGAIKSLGSQKIEPGVKKTIEVDYVFQIEKASKNSNNNMHSCTLLDADSKYGGFILQYEQKDGHPGVGDIIHVSKVLTAQLPGRESYVFYCKNVKLIRRAMPLQVDPNKLDNLSKKKSLENYRNSVYKEDNENYNKNNGNERNRNTNYNNYNNKRDNLKEPKNANYDLYDDSVCTLISTLTTFTNNAILYVKCKAKNQIKTITTKATRKDCTIQNYIFVDTKGDEIQATAFNKAAENYDKLIQEGEIYEIRKGNISLAERAYNPTKCDYRITLNESTQVTKVEDNGKFGEIKFSIVPLAELIDYPIGKIVDVFGIVLEDRGFNEFTTKTEKTLQNRRIILGDQSGCKIDLTLWPPLGNPDNAYSTGDLFAIKNCRIREYNGRKNLNSTDSSEIRNTINHESDQILKNFYNEHQNVNDYQDIQGESVAPGVKSIAEFAFIKDVQSTFETEMDDKERVVNEIIGVVTKFNHSEKNYYTGCAKCKKKMETEQCNYCSCQEKKIFLTFSVKVRDASADQWVNFFGELGEKFLGIKGEDYANILKNGTMVEENPELAPINDKICYHTFSFIGKVKENIYQETKRYRFNVFQFTERNPAQKHSLCKLLSNLLK